MHQLEKVARITKRKRKVEEELDWAAKKREQVAEEQDQAVEKQKKIAQEMAMC